MSDVTRECVEKDVPVLEDATGRDAYCHILRREGTTTSASPLVALCGYYPNDRKPHDAVDPKATLCPVCERPRCERCIRQSGNRSIA